MDGVHLFGKTAAHLQCLWMNQFGWSPRSVVERNAIFAIMSLGLLWSFFLYAGYREKWLAFFIALLAATEPFVSTVEKARYECFAFLLLCFALWLAVQGWEFAASLTALLAIETEPAAVIVQLARCCTPACLKSQGSKKLAAKLTCAGLLAISVYLVLHPGAIFAMVLAQP